MSSGSSDLLLVNAEIFAEGTTFHGYIYITEGKIREIGKGSADLHEWQEKLSNSQIIDCNGNLLLPGFIDAHVHFRDMKQEYKETFETGSLAALAGGITTVISMPNTNLPLSTSENVRKYRAYISSQHRKLFVNIGLNFGVLHGFDPAELPKIKESGCFGLKLYPGAASKQLPLNWEDYWQKKDLALGDSAEPLPIIQNFSELYPNWANLFDIAKEWGVPLLFHPEMPESPEHIGLTFSEALKSALKENLPNPHLYAHSKSHDIPGNERALVRMVSTFIKSYASDPIDAPHVHFCHISSATAVKIVENSLKFQDYPATVEITPHHILLNYDITPSITAFGKVLCPLRSPSAQQALYALVKENKTDTFGTDHAPHTHEEKSKEFSKAPSGFPGIDIAVPLFMTEVDHNHIALDQLVRNYATTPAKIFGLKNKGEIAIGKDADLVIVKKTNSVVKSSQSYSKAAWSPYDGRELSAKVEKVILGGILAYDSHLDIKIPAGKMIFHQK